jgi:Domain of unknown function (DUF3846)
MKRISVLSVKVGKEPEVVSVENTLEAMQALVGGYIEVIHLTDDIMMVLNETGKLDELPINFITFKVAGDGLRPIDEICGNVFFVSALGEDFASLDKLQINQVKKMFKYSRNGMILNL